jgi:hypothetical protein
MKKSFICALLVAFAFAPALVSAQSIKIVDKNGNDIPTSKEDVAKKIADKKTEESNSLVKKATEKAQKAESSRQSAEQKQVDQANKKLNKVGLKLAR